MRRLESPYSSTRMVRFSLHSYATLSDSSVDVLRCGIVLTVASGLLALLSFLSLAYNVLPTFRPYAPKSLRLLSYLHFFMALWVFATVVAFDVIVRNRSAKLTAFLGTFQLTEAMIEAQEKLLGMSPAYWSNGYCKSYYTIRVKPNWVC